MAIIRNATPKAIARAAALIRAGRLVGFPTETVYGLGCDATNDRAVASVFGAKGRPSFNPLIVHVADIAGAERLAVLDERAHALAARFWPGPLSIVATRRLGCAASLLVSAGLDTIALRMPAHPVALALIREADLPVAGPSANRSGSVSPTTAGHVAQSLGADVALILDAGRCTVGIESTVIDLSGETATILRPGGLPAEDIAEVIGTLAHAGPAQPDRPASPGMMERHYAPASRMRLNATHAGADEALLAFGPDAPAGAMLTLNLSPSGDLTEAAANLFAMMRALDDAAPAAIAAMPVPERGLGIAINDRLRRAAAPPR